jgi:uncharacterized protein HemX
MSEPTPETPASPPVPVDAAPLPAPVREPIPVDPLRSLRIALVAGLAILAVLIAGMWIDARNRNREIRLEVARRFQQIDEAVGETGKLARAGRDSIADLQSRIALLEGRLAEAQSQQAALEELYRELTPGRDDWTVTEVEQVLLLASQQLQLAANVRGALTALQLADAQLQRADRPRFLPLRRAIARDMEALKAVPYVDVSGIALRLDQATAAIDKLPLAAEARVGEPDRPAAPKSDSRVGDLLSEMWDDIRQMVRIENMQRQEVPLLLPSQEYYLRENLKLRFLSARLALLSREEQPFRADLRLADDWLRRYFDTRAKSTQSLMQLLKQLQGTELPTDMPDLSASLEAVRVLKAARERSTR